MNFITRRHKIYRDLIDHITSRILEMEDGEKSSFHKLTYEFFRERGFDLMMIEVTYETRDLYGDGWYSKETGSILVLPDALFPGIREKVLENIGGRKILGYSLTEYEEDDDSFRREFSVADPSEMTYIEPANYFPKEVRRKLKLGEYSED